MSGLTYSPAVKDPVSLALLKAGEGGIAFFDVDHTLVQGSTAFHCTGILRREGILTRRDMVRIAVAHLRHHLGILDYERVYAMGVRPFVGTSFDGCCAILDEAFRDCVKPHIHVDGIACMQAHRAAGEAVVLLSASSAWLLERFSQVAPIDGVVAFRQHVRDGRFIDDWDRPIPYGVNKRTLAEAYAAKAGIGLDACAFYSDSTSDQPLLEAVGRPVAVNPDPRLRWTAWRRGWPVVQWRRTMGSRT
jgi:HAD superfamily hydrolase (TIGR01490 family)